MADSPVPGPLLSAVKRDLRPVRSLASPSSRALALLPLGAILLIGIPAFWAWWSDLAWVAPGPSWGLSALETTTGLATLAIGFREAIPGRQLSNAIWSAVFALAWIVFLLINATTPAPDAGVPIETTVRWLRECVTMATAFSVPALAVVGWLVSRALPGRPALTGAACGLGVGLMADAGLRLFCWDGDLLHVVLAHGGAVAILMALGALSALAIERVRERRRA